MRLIVLFDLPVVEIEDRRAYTKFRKFLLNDGFIMMQQSVYSKLALNNSACNSIKNRVRKNTPKKGIVQMLIITEKQYASIEYMVGKAQTTKIEDTERLTIL